MGVGGVGGAKSGRIGLDVHAPQVKAIAIPAGLNDGGGFGQAVAVQVAGGCKVFSLDIGQESKEITGVVLYPLCCAWAVHVVGAFAFAVAVVDLAKEIGEQGVDAEAAGACHGIAADAGPVVGAVVVAGGFSVELGGGGYCDGLDGVFVCAHAMVFAVAQDAGLLWADLAQVVLPCCGVRASPGMREVEKFVLVGAGPEDVAGEDVVEAAEVWPSFVDVGAGVGAVQSDPVAWAYVGACVGGCAPEGVVNGGGCAWQAHLVEAPFVGDDAQPVDALDQVGHFAFDPFIGGHPSWRVTGVLQPLGKALAKGGGGLIHRCFAADNDDGQINGYITSSCQEGLGTRAPRALAAPRVAAKSSGKQSLVGNETSMKEQVFMKVLHFWKSDFEKDLVLIEASFQQS